MRMTRRLWLQLAVLMVIAITAFTVMAIGYARLPNLLFGIGHYRVTLNLTEAAGLYERANVTYLGTEVGKVDKVELTDTGVQAVLSLRSDVAIPADLDAQVHSTSAVGEQYVALLPREDSGPTLKNGDVIAADRTSTPPDISSLLDATNTGLNAIPQDNLKTTIDESYAAVGGLGPDLSRLVKGSTALAIDAQKNLADLTNVVDNVAPILDTQTDTASSVQAWAAHLANITGQLKNNDQAVKTILTRGPGAADETRALFERLQPTLPIVLANLTSIAPVLVTYRADIEQILVLLPQGVAIHQATSVANRDVKKADKGAFLSFNLNLNLPPPCTTGFLPAQQRRAPSDVDAPPRPDGDLYCRIPQDAMFNVRGARNLPCETRPGKRAPTVKMCESDENYVPLNDGWNWKGDPNATLSGQPIPQPPPGTPTGSVSPPPGAPPVAIAEYDPATGQYVGPDGRVYTQTELAQTAPKEQTWQNMLTPPPN
ncbi:MCE family protein [Mycobacterium eburneum]|nr:MlaD family protein [Mycobacterium eburneum]TDH52874.1 MCE family protein [Mycobacterium eburneum]